MRGGTRCQDSGLCAWYALIHHALDFRSTFCELVMLSRACRCVLCALLLFACTLRDLLVCMPVHAHAHSCSTFLCSWFGLLYTMLLLLQFGIILNFTRFWIKKYDQLVSHGRLTTQDSYQITRELCVKRLLYCEGLTIFALQVKLHFLEIVDTRFWCTVPCTRKVSVMKNLVFITFWGLSKRRQSSYS